MRAPLLLLTLLLLFAGSARAESTKNEPSSTGANFPIDDRGEGLSKGAPLDEKAVGEMLKTLEECQRQNQLLVTQMNSIADKFSGIVPEGLAFVQDFGARLASDNRFIEASTKLLKNGNRKKMIGVQLIFFFMVQIFKILRQSAARSWLQRMQISFLSFLVTIFGVSYLIPRLFLGEPLDIIIGTIWRML